MLNKEGVENAEGIARELEVTFARYPHWRVSEAQERDVRRELYRVLLQDKLKTMRDDRHLRETGELTFLVDKVIRIAGRAGEES